MSTMVLRFDLHLPHAHSLKEKRGPLKRLLSELRREFRCAANETGARDLHQRAEIVVAFIASDGANAANLTRSLRDRIACDPDWVPLRVAESVLPDPDFPTEIQCPLEDKNA